MWNGTQSYGCDPSNKRVQKQMTDGWQEIQFYGAMGERLVAYDLRVNVAGHAAWWEGGEWNLYFLGRRFARWWSGGGFTRVALDRLGSENGSNYYPWGEEKQTTGQMRRSSRPIIGIRRGWIMRISGITRRLWG